MSATEVELAKLAAVEERCDQLEEQIAELPPGSDTRLLLDELSEVRRLVGESFAQLCREVGGRVR